MKRVPIVFVLSALLLGTVQAPLAQAAQVTSGLLIDLNVANTNSYSGSGNTWTDLAGSADNGTLTNGPTFSATPSAALVLDGNDDYVQIPNTSALQVTTSNAFTVMAWAKIDTYTAGDGIFGKQYADAQVWDGYSLVINGSNSIALAMNGQSISANYNSTSNVFTLGSWALFTAIVQFGGGSARPSKAYVNGNEVATGSNSDGAIPNNTAPFRIGEGVQGYGQRPAMSVGAFAVYNRVLTAQEISDSYNYYLNYVYTPEISSISLGSLPTSNKGISVTVTATVGAAGKVRFFSNGKRIPNCINVSATGSPLTANCTFKPAVKGSLTISATFFPTTSSLGQATAFKTLGISRRTNTR